MRDYELLFIVGALFFGIGLLIHGLGIEPSTLQHFLAGQQG